MPRVPAGQSVHARSLAKSTAISGYYVENFIGPLEVIRVLNGGGVSFLLAGAHALGGWTGKSRATEDVEVVVAKRHHKKAVLLLTQAFPNLVADDNEVVTRLRDRESKDVLIDVMKSTQPIFRAALKHTHAVTAGRLTYNVPTVEMALAMKFAAMISLTRADVDRLQDAVDFARIVQNNPAIDLDKLAELGELVYPGGGQELVQKVQDVRAGKTLPSRTRVAAKRE